MSSPKPPLPKKLYLAAQVRELDRIAIEEFSIPGITLMESAGDAAYQLMRSKWPEAERILVLCGPGNNGGDGYILARLAKADGLAVKLQQIGDHTKLAGDALLAAEKLFAGGLEPKVFSKAALNQCDVIVDALLGIGLDREVSGASGRKLSMPLIIVIFPYCLLIFHPDSMRIRVRSWLVQSTQMLRFHLLV